MWLLWQQTAELPLFFLFSYTTALTMYDSVLYSSSLWCGPCDRMGIWGYWCYLDQIGRGLFYVLSRFCFLDLGMHCPASFYNKLHAQAIRVVFPTSLFFDLPVLFLFSFSVILSLQFSPSQFNSTGTTSGLSP